MIRVAITLASAVFLLSTSPGQADDSRTDVLVVGYDQSTANFEIPTSYYQLLMVELEQDLLIQNIIMVSGTNYHRELSPFRSRLPWDEPSRLSESIDYVVSYYIEREVNNDGPIDRLNLTVRGEISDAVTGVVLDSFRTPEISSRQLIARSSQCDMRCITEALDPLADDLSDQFSFVLTQKLHFLNEDKADVNVTDPTAILERLREGTQRPATPRSISSDRGVFEIDEARSVNIEVFFDFNSHILTAQAIAQLEPLAEALSSPDIGERAYLIVGHTDASGPAPHNQVLSERRADAVRRHFLENYPIDPVRLVAIGVGETQLRSPAEPRAAVNRRVEIALLLNGS